MLCPPASRSASKAKRGSSSAPSEANGPASRRLTGPCSGGEPLRVEPQVEVEPAALDALVLAEGLLEDLRRRRRRRRRRSAASATANVQRSREMSSSGRRDMAAQRTLAPLDGLPHDPLHGQGRRRQDLGRRGDRPALRRGRRCGRSCMSTDPAHSLADALGEEVGSEPAAVGERLWAQQVSAQEEMERNWASVQDWMGDMLVERGVDRISAEELTVPPGRGRDVQPARAAPPPRVRRVRRGDRRLRADRRDAAAALVPRRRALVAREDLPAAGPDPRRGAAVRARRARRPAPGRRGARATCTASSSRSSRCTRSSATASASRCGS